MIRIREYSLCRVPMDEHWWLYEMNDTGRHIYLEDSLPLVRWILTAKRPSQDEAGNLPGLVSVHRVMNWTDNSTDPLEFSIVLIVKYVIRQLLVVKMPSRTKLCPVVQSRVHRSTSGDTPEICKEEEICKLSGLWTWKDAHHKLFLLLMMAVYSLLV